MGMTIDDAIETLEDTNSYGTADIAKSVAIETMRKYQKIQEIMHKVYAFEQADECLVQRLSEIREVLEDGNDS